MCKQNTEVLNKKILKSTNIKEFIREHKESIRKSEFHHHLYALLEEKEIKNSELFNRSNLSESYGYQLINGKRQPSRNKVLQIALGLNLNIHESNQLLKLAEKSALYVKDKRDAIIIYALNNDLSLFDTNDILYEENCDLLD